MLVRVKNVHRVVAKGKVYHYHRPTKTKLTEAPGSPEFLARVNALNTARKPRKAAATSMGSLLEVYRAAPEFTRLANNSKLIYEKNLAWLDRRALMPLSQVDGPFVIGLRDRVFHAHGRTQANQMISMIRTLWAFGSPRGLTSGQPAYGVKDIPRPKGLARRNRRWTPEELVTFIEHCPRWDLALAVLLASHTALRESDVVALRWSQYNGSVIEGIQTKTGDGTYIPVTLFLKAALDGAPRVNEYIIPNGNGQHKPKAFASMFIWARNKLVEQKLVGKGLTFHGLRHTLASDLADAGADDRMIMSITGHRSTSSVKVYTRDADRKRAAIRATELLAAVKHDVKPE
jgi:integrase